MGKHFNESQQRALEKLLERQNDRLTAQHAAGWDDFEPRHVTLADELYAPGVKHVRLGRERS
jgi:hypothetical protein